MKLQVETQIDICAPAPAVWFALMDFDRHPDWNPFVRSILGVPEPGNRLQVQVQAPGSSGMTFRPVVLRKRENQEFSWQGQLLVPGLFDGEHYFRLEPLDLLHTRLIHGELFSGLLVRLAHKGLTGATRQGFEAMNLALKRRVETAHQGIAPSHLL